MTARWCLLGLLFFSLGAAKLEKSNRVANDKHGVCMWCCIEAVGRQRQIPQTYDLRDAVIEKGIGRDNGAEAVHIAYWAVTRQFRAVPIVPQPPSGLRYRAELGQHVIAICKDWNDWQVPKPDPKHSQHAVVILDVTAEKETRLDGRNHEFTDHWVTYYDPNQPQDDLMLPWSAFGKRYIQGYVIEPHTTITASDLDLAIRALLTDRTEPATGGAQSASSP